ncbi:MAG: hypothetical protein HY658_04345 [Actinobacteria bacterium]|nr:hypothetical protein [Actinomycetota bacterium]
MEGTTALVELLAAMTYGERRAAARARDNARFAPDERRRLEQLSVAAREEQNWRLVEARLLELGSMDMATEWAPFFDAFFERTEPGDWVQAQAWHYIGDSLVSDFAEVLVGVVDPVSAEVLRRSLGDREAQEAFALDELTRAMEEDPGIREGVAHYARGIAGEALNQTRRALARTRMLKELLGGEEGEKRVILDLLDRHRARLDRLRIDRIEVESFDDLDE